MTVEKPSFSRVFYVALLATTCFALSLTMLLPILPLFITDELGVGEHLIGTATFIIALTAAIARIPGGALSDRFGRRTIMLVGAGLGVLAAAVYFLSHSFPVFLVARLLSGISLALFTTTGKALVADLSPPTRRGEALGLSNAAFSLAIIASPLLGEWITQTFSFRATFAVSGGLTLLTFVITMGLPGGKPQRTAAANAGHDLRDTMRERGIWSALFIMIAMGAILALVFSYYPLLAERKNFYADAPRFLSTIALSLGLSMWAITDTIIEPIAGRLSDRIGRQVTAIPGLFIIVVGIIMMSQAHNTTSAYASIVILATGWGITRGIADAIGQDALPPVLRGMGSAVMYTSFDLAVGIDAQILGTLIDGTDFSAFFQFALVFVISFGTLGLLLATRLRSYDQRIAPLPPPAIGR